MAPSYQSPNEDDTPEPRRNLFGNTGNSRFAGETPFRSGTATSSGLFTPTPGPTRTTRGGLFGNYKASQDDQDEEAEEEEDEDGDYEVDETPITKVPAASTGPFSHANVAKQGVPHSEGQDYNSPTDDDEEELSYRHGNGEHDEEGEVGEEEGEYADEDDEGEDGEEGEDEADEEEEEGGDEEIDEEDSGEMDDEDEAMEDNTQETPRQQRQNQRHRSFRKPPVSKEVFLQNNPPLLIKRSNNVLRSLANLLAPAEEREDTLPEASPIHRPPAITAGKKVGYLAKYISIFLSDLQSVSRSAHDPCISNAYYLASLLLNIQHPSAQAVGRPNFTPSPIEVFKSFLNTHHPNPTSSELQHLHTYHPTPCASPDYWPILAHLTLRGDLAEVESLLSRGGWGDIIEKKSDRTEDFKYQDAEVDLIGRVVNGAVKLVAAAPQLFVKGRAEHERFAEWRIFRGRVHAAIEELKSLSHSNVSTNQGEEDEGEPEYRYETVITTKNGFTTRMKQKVKVIKPKPMKLRGEERPPTKAPRDVEAGLMNIYQLLVGKIDTIITVAERWQEAVLGASIWRRYFDEEDLEDDLDLTDSPNGSGFLNRSIRASSLRPNVSRSALNQRSGARRSKRTYNELETLKSSFGRVTAKDFPIDSTNILEVGTGHILKGDWKALLDLITSKEEGMAAYTVADFTLEVAKLADWSTADCEDLVADKDIYVSMMRGFRNEEMNNILSKMEGNSSDGEAERARKTRKWEQMAIENYVRCLVRAGPLSEPREDEMDLDADEGAITDVEGWEIGVEVLQRWSTLTMGEELEWSRKLAGEVKLHAHASLSSYELTKS